jgi:hypothetical protein
MPNTRLPIVWLALVAVAVTTALARSAEARYFGGYHCTDHCKKHAEGFRWARETRTLDPGSRVGVSRSHVEGCRVYSRDRMRDPGRDDDGHPTD